MPASFFTNQMGGLLKHVASQPDFTPDATLQQLLEPVSASPSFSPNASTGSASGFIRQGRVFPGGSGSLSSGPSAGGLAVSSTKK